MNWELRAECKHMDQDLFFPKGEGEGLLRVKHICEACPVRKECLMHSIQPGKAVMPGIWGGMTTADRTKLKRSLTSVSRQR